MSEGPIPSGSSDRKSSEQQRISTSSDVPNALGVSSPLSGTEDADEQTFAPITPESSTYLLNDPKLKDIMLSDVGVEALLLRLKQSIATVKEMSHYIKRMATLETEHSAHLKKVSISMSDAFKRSDIKKGTCQNQILSMMKSTDRYGDAGVTFIDSMHKIHDELNEVVKNMERSRKSTKELALRHEKNLLDAEREVEKAKAKYDTACEDLEKARTSDPNKSKLGFKNKSEEELHRKMTIAETDYQQKVDNCQRIRHELVSKHRVGVVYKLQGLILECDNALSLQLVRYSNLLETLQLNRGFVITPLKPQNASTSNQSMKEMACKIDSELDFYNFICSIAKSKTVLNRPPVVFKKHPALGPSKASKSIPGGGPGGPGGSGMVGGPTSPASAGPRQFASQQFGNSNYGPSSGGDRKVSSSSGVSNASNVPAPSMMLSSGTAKTGPVLMKSPTLPNSSFTPVPQQNVQPQPSQNFNTPQSSMHPSQFNTTSPPTQSPVQQAPAGMGGMVAPQASVPSPSVPPQQPQQQQPTIYDPSQHGLAVYGTPLEDLLDYEEGTVPRVVYQCIQAIDNFGLDVEGIYRLNGNSNQVKAIREQFDIDAAAVDLLRPQDGVNDIHSVATALKQYFQALPDSLLTDEFHEEFLSAAAITDEVRRRDSIHAIINNLPDPNYTTLRYLVFHLYRVQERSGINKMDVTNLGVVWGPILMKANYQNVEEMASESRVVQTILTNAYAIFEAE